MINFGLSLLGDGRQEAQKGDPLLAELERIIRNREIRTVYQPVVSLTEGSIIGYEALSRGPAGSLLERPDKLFQLANQYGLTWELEFLCRVKALEKLRGMDNSQMVFLNIDPKIINDPRFKKGLTKEVLSQYGLDATKVIFEITEKTAIEDYKAFRRVLENYTSQGYKIAIDDTGSGYSGLKMLAQTHPHYIKVDMELVRDIDKDGLKQAMMKALYDFAVMTNSKIIAEGIETEDELSTLIEIGVPYGQGYYLQRPAEDFRDIAPAVRLFIVSRSERKRREIFYTALTTPIGEIVRRDSFFSPTTTGHEALDFFNDNPNILGVPVVDNNRPVGLLMKNKFLASLATQYGVAVYMHRPISLLMENQPLIIEHDTPLEQVAKSALARTDDNIYDYILVIKDGEYLGTTTIKRLLEKVSQLELNRAKHSNPLTGLPGNVIIEEKLKEIIADRQEYAVLYFDLDNFKAYNDVYGFENGDKLLCATAQLVNRNLELAGLGRSFLGHIGGDDFIAVVRSQNVEEFCNSMIQDFDSRVQDFYTEEDKRNGFILTANRHGVTEKYPLVTLSIAVVTNKSRLHRSPEEIGEAAGQVKKACKMTWQSCFRVI